MKVEDKDETYNDIGPRFNPKKRLKIGTFKRVDEIYLTIFNKRDDQKRLISLLVDWGVREWGKKNNGELVYVRDFSKKFNKTNPKETYPFISLKDCSIFIVPIYPQYHTELFPDSILRTESPEDFKEDKPHRKAIQKVYISRSIERNVNRDDVLLFYRTAERERPAYYSNVVTTICLVEEKIENIKDVNDFILKCRKRSIFNNNELKKCWYANRYKPFIINFLHIYPFRDGERINRKSY